MAKANVNSKNVKPFEFEDITESLSDKQMLFCMEYVGASKFNGTLAAKAAGYSEKCAKETASYLLTHPNIKTYIDSLKKDLSLRIGVTAEMIANEYKEIGFAKITDVVGGGNEVMDVTNIGDKAKLIQSVKTTTTENEYGVKTVSEVRLYNKLEALDKLARMLNVDGVTKVANTLVDGTDKTDQIIIYTDTPQMKKLEG